MSYFKNLNCNIQSILGFILFLILTYVFIYIPFTIFPAEDAAILFQFSENFANTGSITYNLNGIHTEGATDFLWMILLGVMNFIGFEVYMAATTLSLFALLGTAYLLYKIIGKNNIYYFYIFTVLLLALPTTFAAVQGFSPLFFGFFITLSVYYFIKQSTVKLFLSLLLLTLVRPDGIIFAIPLIITYFITHTISIKKDFFTLVKFFILPGLVYFLWRWHYFNEFLPLPFYVKSNFIRYNGIFNKESLDINYYILQLFVPLIIFSTLVIIKNRLPKYTIPLIISVIISPYLFYSTMMLSQNISYRFQYSFILGIIILFAFSLRNHKSILLSLSFIAITIYQIVILYPITKSQYQYSQSIVYENITYIAKGLNKITTDATMAITEAGRLPYYSKWKTIDTWGLNTAKFSKTLIQPNDIKLFNPDLIVIHACCENYDFLAKNLNNVHKKRTWVNMCENITKGIDKKKYTLFMVPFYTSGKGRHDAFFLKNNFKYFNQVKQLLIHHKAISFLQYTHGKYTLMKDLNKISSSKQLIKSNFNVYLLANKLLYIKRNCTQSDINQRFFLHLFPMDKNVLNQEDYNYKYGFIGSDFNFNDFGVINNHLCIASIDLPKFKLEKIQTGQFYGYKRFWDKGFNFEKNSSF